MKQPGLRQPKENKAPKCGAPPHRRAGGEVSFDPRERLRAGKGKASNRAVGVIAHAQRGPTLSPPSAPRPPTENPEEPNKERIDSRCS